MYSASRTQQLQGNFFAQIEKRIHLLKSQGDDVIRLDIGSPDLPPSPEVVRALIDSASRPENHGYQPHLGIPELRRAWSDHYTENFNVYLDPDTEILPLLGSKEGIFHYCMAVLNPGDIVLIPDPGYMTYTRGALFAGAVPHYINLNAENQFLLDFQSINPEIVKNAKILWLNYPNNPTGATATIELFQQAVDFARHHQLFLAHDNAYAQVTFEGYTSPSILQIPGAKECTVEFNSLSKSHNMPGWRSGIVVGNRDVIQAILKVKTNIDSGGFRPVLDASVVALHLKKSWLEERNLIYQARRDLLLSALANIGLVAAKPKASIYIWAKIPPGKSSVDFCSFLLEKAKVSLTPGIIFGPSGEGYVRIALTTSTERIKEAVSRIVNFM